jgi:hypothetical protein
MDFFEVQKTLREREKANEGKILLTAPIANEMTEIVNNALTTKDISFRGIRSNYGDILLSGGDGVGQILKDSYKYLEEGKTPKEVTFGNLQTAHMLRLKKAFENLDLRIELKRKQEALKRKSDKLNVSKRTISNLKEEITRLISLIDLIK